MATDASATHRTIFSTRCAAAHGRILGYGDMAWYLIGRRTS